MCCTNPRLRLAPSWTRRRFPLEAAKVRLSARFSLILMISMVHDGVFFLRSRRVPGTAVFVRPFVLEHLGSVCMVGIENFVRESDYGTADKDPGELSPPKDLIKRFSFLLNPCVTLLLAFAQNPRRSKISAKFGADPCRQRRVRISV